MAPEPEQTVGVVEQEVLQEVQSSRAEVSLVATGGALIATGEGPSGGGVYTNVVDKATVCEISVHGRVLRAASLTSSSRVRLADGARATAARARVSTMEASLSTDPAAARCA